MKNHVQIQIKQVRKNRQECRKKKNDEKLINTAKEIEKNEEDVDAADVPEATPRPPTQSARSPWSNHPKNAVLPVVTHKKMKVIYDRKPVKNSEEDTF